MQIAAFGADSEAHRAVEIGWQNSHNNASVGKQMDYYQANCLFATHRLCSCGWAVASPGPAPPAASGELRLSPSAAQPGVLPGWLVSPPPTNGSGSPSLPTSETQNAQVGCSHSCLAVPMGFLAGYPKEPGWGGEAPGCPPNSGNHDFSPPALHQVGVRHKEPERNRKWIRVVSSLLLTY